MELPTELFHSGDIVFRRGGGLVSRAVIYIGRDGVYSHTGILNRHADGSWWVTHAVPGETAHPKDPDRVKTEPVEEFFAADKARSGGVMRVCIDSMLCVTAASHAERLATKGVLFDHDYDLADTTRLYCTELIDYVYRTQGIDIAEGRARTIYIPGLQGKYLFPDDIAQSSKLETIYFF